MLAVGYWTMYRGVESFIWDCASLWRFSIPVFKKNINTINKKKKKMMIMKEEEEK
jgi:hypothetical protein